MDIKRGLCIERLKEGLDGAFVEQDGFHSRGSVV